MCGGEGFLTTLACQMEIAQFPPLPSPPATRFLLDDERELFAQLPFPPPPPSPPAFDMK